MKHVFIVISNICSIVIHDTVMDLVSKNENVLIVTDRNANWLFPNVKVNIYDISNLYKEYRIYKSANINQFVRKIIYRILIKNKVYNIVGNEKYYLYIPNMALDYAHAFVENKLCAKYCLIEEGVLSYIPIDDLKRRFRKSSLKKSIKKLVGISHYFSLETTGKFDHTICINEKAFRWDKSRRINDTHFLTQMNDGTPMFKHIIILSYIRDVERTKEAMTLLIRFLSSMGISILALKFHPHSMYYEKEAVEDMKNWINSLPVKISILPPSSIVEVCILGNKSIVYSVEQLSSLSLYSYLWNGISYVVKNSKSGWEVIPVDSFEAFQTNV